ncbi:IS3 family transposase [Bifidobacterium bifidum]|uniref:IS3 family transposase n=1 Tax=Bifidobacterium bifidum TaxID=1681 RepID=UPI00286F6F56|nr:IS3 family transposase [Bifidobacterium bifidum]
MIGLLPGESPTWRGVFENSSRRYGYRRVHLELRGAGVVVSAKRVIDGPARARARVQEREALLLVQG